jgi:cytochrome oxidase Cu insertion factor (SCO1/SenC/PrrC family)
MSVAANLDLGELADKKQTVAEYNFQHFRMHHLLKDALATMRSKGLKPGQLAPDFTMSLANGGRVTLSQLRDKPVVLHFGSFT